MLYMFKIQNYLAFTMRLAPWYQIASIYKNIFCNLVIINFIGVNLKSSWWAGFFFVVVELYYINFICKYLKDMHDSLFIR